LTDTGKFAGDFLTLGDAGEKSDATVSGAEKKIQAHTAKLRGQWN
jgi:hypothetical protein